ALAKTRAGAPLTGSGRDPAGWGPAALSRASARAGSGAFAAARAAGGARARRGPRPAAARARSHRTTPARPPRVPAARRHLAGGGLPRERPRGAPARQAPARHAARAAGGVRGRRDPPLLAPQPDELRRRHELLPARLVHDEVQPEDQRGHGAAARLPPPPPAG